MTFYKVTYEHKAGIFCTNIASADSAADVEAYYSNHPIIDLRTITNYELSEAIEKHMPIVRCEPATKAAQTAQQTEAQEGKQEEKKTMKDSRKEAHPGDVITCAGMKRTIATIEYQNHDESTNTWTIEGCDTNNRYFYWKQAFDGGKIDFMSIEAEPAIFAACNTRKEYSAAELRAMLTQYIMDNYGTSDIFDDADKKAIEQIADYAENFEEDYLEIGCEGDCIIGTYADYIESEFKYSYEYDETHLNYFFENPGKNNAYKGMHVWTDFNDAMEDIKAERSDALEILKETIREGKCISTAKNYYLLVNECNSEEGIPYIESFESLRDIYTTLDCTCEVIESILDYCIECGFDYTEITYGPLYLPCCDFTFAIENADMIIDAALYLRRLKEAQE